MGIEKFENLNSPFRKRISRPHLKSLVTVGIPQVLADEPLGLIISKMGGGTVKIQVSQIVVNCLTAIE